MRLGSFYLRWPRIDRLSWRIGICMAALVVTGLAGGFFFINRTYSQHLLAVTRSHTLVESWLIRLALEHEMPRRDQTLVRDMVRSLARQLPVERVMILDRAGQVRISSDPTIDDSHFLSGKDLARGSAAPPSPAEVQRRSPTCQVCHELPPGRRTQTVVLEADEGKVLRSVQPIPNRPSCHRCHDPKNQINGVLIVDVPLRPTLGTLEQATRRLALGTGAVGLLLLCGIGLAFRRLIMRRLIRFESTARAIARGDLSRRVPIQGSDALSRLETEFNQMADSVGHLLAQVQAQRSSLENVINSVADGVVVLDRARRVVAANRAFAARFGGTPAEMIGRPCCQVRAPGLQDNGAALVCGEGGPEECTALGCFASGLTTTSLRNRTAADGRVRQEEVRASPVRGPGGSIEQVVEVWRDITERRSAEARLADQQRLVSLGMLAAGFSHEVNTPLASIATCLSGIERSCGEAGGLDSPVRAELLDLTRTALSQVERCGAITQQFLHLARGKALGEEIVDLPEAARVVASLVTPTAREVGVSVAVEHDGAQQVPPIIANGSAVRQVLLNLVLNAVHASSRGQAVTISFRVRDSVEVLVADQGRGIAPEDLPRVFEPFFSRREKGTGLGLFVSLSFARGWSGDILADSQPGRGTCFTIVFPRAERALPAGPRSIEADGLDTHPARR